MAGLLDFLNTPESALGLNLLAAAQSGQGFGPGLLGAIQNTQKMQRASKQETREDQEFALQGRYRDAQIQELQRKSIADARRAAREEAWYGGTPEAGMGAAPSTGLLGGAAGVSAGQPSAQTQAPQTTNAETGLAQISQQFGIPVKALQADIMFNGGKKISELISKAAEPNWVNVGANLVNTRDPGFRGGIQDQVSISNDGRATVLRGNNGNPVVGAPAGALDTYAAYQNIGNASNAAFTPERIYNPQTQREEIVPRTQALRGMGQPQNFTGGGYAGGSSGAAGLEQARIIQAELDRLPANHPDRPAIMRELQRLGVQSAPAQSGNYAAGPSAPEVAANEARRVQAVEQTKADITPTAQKLSAVTTARDALGVIDQALQHPGLKTATGVSGAMDPRNYISGTDATNFRVLMDQIRGGVFLDAYKDLRGGGAITEVEGQKAEAAKARINRAQSPDEFVKGLQEYRAIVDRGYERARQQLPANTGGASGSWDSSSTAQQATRATMRFNPQTGRLEKVN